MNLTAGHEGITARHAPIMSSDVLVDSDVSELYSLQNSLFDSLKSGLTNLPDRSNEVRWSGTDSGFESGQRNRREVEKIIRPVIVKSSSGDKELKTVIFDCDRGTAKCIHIK